MIRQTVLSFRPDDDIYEAMKLLRERDGVPLSQQIRRGLRAWLETKGVLQLAAANRRGAARTPARRRVQATTVRHK